MSSIEAIDRHIEDMAEKAEKAAAIEESEAVEAVETTTEAVEKAEESTTDGEGTEATTEAVEEVIERPYEMRKLNNGDFSPVLKILTKVLPDDLKGAFAQVITGEKTLKEIGGMVACDMLVMVVKNIPMAQNEVDRFCASMIGKTVEELNEMEFGTTALILYDVFGDAKNTSFFKVLSKLL